MKATTLIAQALLMAAATDPRMRNVVLIDPLDYPVDPFAAFEQSPSRTLSREEALEAFRPSAEDLRRVAAAEQKRARRAAKLRSLA